MSPDGNKLELIDYLLHFNMWKSILNSITGVIVLVKSLRKICDGNIKKTST